ncbi:Glutamyl-tRNA reductase [Orobanche minor]
MTSSSGCMKETNYILLIGFNYHKTPIELREKLCVAEAQCAHAIGELCSLDHVQEAAVLSTCNRLEIYVVALSIHHGMKQVMECMSKISSVPVSELYQHNFVLQDEDVARHLFRVSSGIDSVVLGECQILSQVKQVVKMGHKLPGFGRVMATLFERAIIAGKCIRTKTNISAGHVSISSVVVDVVMKKLPKSCHPSVRILVVGAGRMGRLVIKHIATKKLCTAILVVNRTENKVTSIQEELKDVVLQYRPFSELLTCAGEADVQTLPPVSPEVGGQRIFVDIAVPRNVGPCVSDVENVRVFNVDDLKESAAANKEKRFHAGQEAKAIIEEEVKWFIAKRASLHADATIGKLAVYAEGIRATEVARYMSIFGDDLSKKKKKAITKLSERIVTQLLHGPIQHLKIKNKSDGTSDRELDEMLKNARVLNRIFSFDDKKNKEEISSVMS